MGVAVAAMLAVLLLGFGTVVTVQSARIARERDQANTARQESEVVTEFLSDMLLAVAPEEKGSDVLVNNPDTS